VLAIGRGDPDSLIRLIDEYFIIKACKHAGLRDMSGIRERDRKILFAVYGIDEQGRRFGIRRSRKEIGQAYGFKVPKASVSKIIRKFESWHGRLMVFYSFLPSLTVDQERIIEEVETFIGLSSLEPKDMRVEIIDRECHVEIFGRIIPQEDPGLTSIFNAEEGRDFAEKFFGPTIEGPKPFVSVKVSSKGNFPCAYMVYYPFPNGMELEKSVYKGKYKPTFFLKHLEELLSRQSLSIRGKILRIEKFGQLAVFLAQ
jgi:hypothetical protein